MKFRRAVTRLYYSIIRKMCPDSGSDGSKFMYFEGSSESICPQINLLPYSLGCSEARL